MTQIVANMWVTVHYKLFDSSGESIEVGQREITYLHGGFGAIFEALETALDGKAEGDTVSIYLQPEDSFGDYDAELVRLAPRELFPAELEEGMTFEGVPGEDADGLMYIATDIADEGVVLDANHPLAGMSLHFEMKIIDVHAATPEEIADETERVRAERDDDHGAYADDGQHDHRGDDGVADDDDDSSAGGAASGQAPDGPRVIH